MAGSVKTYAFVNAMLRARISKILPEAAFERMAAARSLEEALGLLADTPYAELAEIYEKTGDLKLGELELFRREVGLYRELAKYLHGELLEVLNALTLRFEIDTLKNGLRLFFDRTVRGRPIDDAVHYVYREPILHDVPTDAVINAESLDGIVDSLGGTPYAQIVENNRAAFEEDKTLFRLEMDLDRFYYRNLIQAVRALDPLDRTIALRLIGVEIDLQNVGWVVRFRTFMNLPIDKTLAFLIPGGRALKESSLREAYTTQNVGELLGGVVRASYRGLAPLLSAQAQDTHSRLVLIEKILEQILQIEVRRMLMGNPFTIGIILAYFMLKRDEMSRIETLLNAKQYGLSEAKVRELL